MAIRAVYEDITGIDQSNPGYGFVMAIDTAAALTAASVVELKAPASGVEGLDADVVETATENAELANLGDNEFVTQRVTADQVVVAALP